ncbi:MAG: carbohydrate kinase family protein [Chloroflexota bacterium]|nr:carbohydrate kinase family protein [Chloroflexota bacterium]
MTNKKVIVAGHTCLDVAPDLSSVPPGQFQTLLQPGKLVNTGGFAMSTGGSVPNTGLSLNRLGTPVQLVGKIGDDLFGRAVMEKISQESKHLIKDMVIDPSSATSITLILNPPGMDRSFLHFEGANATFYASDLPRSTLAKADLFHFGYPTLMRSIYRGEGGELISILQRARRAGLTTSLDFSLPDPTSPAGKVDWPVVLDSSLPLVDLFVPSAEELTFMLRREIYDDLNQDPETHFLDGVTPELLQDLSDQVLGYGVKAVMIKLGHRGVYLRTGDAGVWERGGRALVGIGHDWHDRQLWAPSFSVTARGNTGAGDAAIAGFLSSLLRGTDPETALVMAAAVGACSVESLDVIGKISSWEAVLTRVKQGWETRPLNLASPGWRKHNVYDLWQKD